MGAYGCLRALGLDGSSAFFSLLFASVSLESFLESLPPAVVCSAFQNNLQAPGFIPGLVHGPAHGLVHGPVRPKPSQASKNPQRPPEKRTR